MYIINKTIFPPKTHLYCLHNKKNYQCQNYFNQFVFLFQRHLTAKCFTGPINPRTLKILWELFGKTSAQE